MMVAVLALLAVLAMPAGVPQPEHLDQLATKLQHELQRIATAAPGVVGIAVVDIGSGKRFGVNEDLLFPQGSAIKIPILIELYRHADRGEVKLGDRLRVGSGGRLAARLLQIRRRRSAL